jgi:homocysteine S-methyltransferase
MASTEIATATLNLKDILLGDTVHRIAHPLDPSILLLDGGVSTHLQDNLDDAGGSFEFRELWSSSLLLTAEGRKLVLQGHNKWLEAGSDILSTTTYQCHYEQALWARNIDQSSILCKEQVDRMFHDAVDLARQAQSSTTKRGEIHKAAYVAVSLGCYGAALANGAEYTGDYGDRISVDDLVRFHRRKLEQALRCQPDAVAFETIPSYMECRALAQVLAETSTSQAPSCATRVACWISLACRNGSELNDGTPVSRALDCLSMLPVSQLQGIDFNCCDGQHLPQLASILLQHMASDSGTKRAILLYPNSGEVWDAASEAWEENSGCTSAAAFAESLMQVVSTIVTDWPENMGSCPAIVVGGCCRTRPDSIRELRRCIDQLLEHRHRTV